VDETLELLNDPVITALVPLVLASIEAMFVPTLREFPRSTVCKVDTVPEELFIILN
jgi:hypothetical protein